MGRTQWANIFDMRVVHKIGHLSDAFCQLGMAIRTLELNVIKVRRTYLKTSHGGLWDAKGVHGPSAGMNARS